MYCLLKHTVLVNTIWVTITHSIINMIFGRIIIPSKKPKLFVKLRKYLVVLTQRKNHFQLKIAILKWINLHY